MIHCDGGNGIITGGFVAKWGALRRSQFEVGGDFDDGLQKMKAATTSPATVSQFTLVHVLRSRWTNTGRDLQIQLDSRVSLKLSHTLRKPHQVVPSPTRNC